MGLFHRFRTRLGRTPPGVVGQEGVTPGDAPGGQQAWRPAGEAEQTITVVDRTHDGISLVRRGGSWFISAWAENWDATWSWEAEVTADEAEAAAHDPDVARELLQTERSWWCTPPRGQGWGHLRPYAKRGRLGSRDGFTDGGTGRGGW